jgi:hypothetical protein
VYAIVRVQNNDGAIPQITNFLPNYMKIVPVVYNNNGR